MRRRKWIFVVAPLAFIVFIAIGGVVVRELWNWLLPGLFGWPQITFWKALGMLALCRILFGGFGGGGVRSNMRGRMHDRPEKISEEEREKIREGLHERYGSAPDSKPGAQS